MFKRALKSTYICPTCRRNSFLRCTKPAVHYVHKRWHNSAAHATREDIDDSDRQTEDRPMVRQFQSSTRYRHWRPTPTAQLGVDTLGQPAEVLILPKSHRNTPKSEVDDNDDDDDDDDGVDSVAQKTLAESPVIESIAAESKPPPAEEISKHIEAIKSDYRTTEGRLRHNEWLQMKKALAKSFTVKQLMQYYEGEMGKSKHLEHVKSLSRPAMAEKVMTDVWSCTNISQKKPEQAPPKQPKVIYRTEHVRLFMINQRRLRATKIIEPDVELAQVTSRSIQFSGPADAVERTMNSLRAYESQIAQLHLPVPPNLRGPTSIARVSATETRQNSDDLKNLQDIVLRSGVVLRSGDKNGLSTKIYGLDDAHIKTFLQRLMLWNKSVTRLTAALPLSSYPSTELCNVPVAVDELYQGTSLWQRYVLKRPTGSKNNHRPSILSNNVGEDLRSTFLKALVAPEHSLLNPAIFDSGIHSDSIYSAEIGLAIFQQPETTVEREDEALDHSIGEDRDTTSAGEVEEIRQEETVRSGSSSPVSTMITHIPLLAQFLAQQQPLHPALNQSHSHQLEIVEPETLIRLVYKCLDGRYPSIEIYASVDKSKIEVERITCLLKSVQRYVALPNLVADLKVDKISSTSLYQHGLPLDTRFSPFLATLTRALNSITRDRLGKVIGVEPSVRLDLSPLITRMSANSQGLVSEEKVAPEERGMKDILYILSAAEQVEHAMYKTPVKSSFALEHLMFTPLRDSPDQTPSQVLRVVEKPLLWQPPTERKATIHEQIGDQTITEQEWKPLMIESNQDSFDAFVKAAHGTVVALDRFTNNKSRSIVEATTRVERKQNSA